MDTPSNNSFKSYMGYKTITSKNSNQYKLQQNAYTDDKTGIRMVDNKYCIAVGSYYTTDIGTHIDLIMENESVVECILADVKADIHTDITNRQNPNGSIVEFIVDTKNMDKMSKKMGDMSYADERLEGEIKYIRVYKED